MINRIVRHLRPRETRVSPWSCGKRSVAAPHSIQVGRPVSEQRWSMQIARRLEIRRASTSAAKYSGPSCLSPIREVLVTES
ncbi:hypothetical protein MJ956_11285 [Aurantimonas sp. LRZ36]|uniref:Uncharacterized protein n=1 Tax=Aurantimonas marianensis TaxID=2920428 RepID=A0A9X2KIL3_9HYPH|nr:hypothetical protein [Aurantimonas marianensis]